MDQWIYPWYHTEGGLNYNAAGSPALDELLVAQRREADPAAKKEIWQQVWDAIHDQVWDFWWPEGFAESAWHNYVLNFRPHGWMGSASCYTSNQFRSSWLDEGHQMQGSSRVYARRSLEARAESPGPPPFPKAALLASPDVQ